MKHLQTFVAGSLLLFCTSLNTHAATVSFGGISYDTVDWTSANPTTETALGTAPGNSVSYSTVDIQSSTIDSDPTTDYASDPSFDALTYGPGSIEILNVFAGKVGTTTMTFITSVNSVLLFLGAPSSLGVAGGLNLGDWDFANDLTLTIADTSGLVIDPGNILDAGSGGEGVVRVARTDAMPFSSLSFVQDNTGGGGDGMDFSLAVNTVPEPSRAFLSVLALCGIAGRRRRIRLIREISRDN